MRFRTRRGLTACASTTTASSRSSQAHARCAAPTPSARRRVAPHATGYSKEVTNRSLRVRALGRLLPGLAALLVLGVGPPLAAGGGAGLTVNLAGRAAAGLLAVGPEPGGTGWEANAGALGPFLNQQFDYVCPAYGSSGTVWGTGVYTYDSSVCTAAVLEGRITLAGGGKVVIEVLPGRGSYQGSTRNGITSNSYGSYFGS